MLVKRRTFILGFAVQFLGFTSPCFPNSELEQYHADQKQIEEWMQIWMAAAKEPVGTLQLSRFADPMYFLTKPITWAPNPGQVGFSPVTVPPGFVTDFASIPRIFWSLLRPDGLYTYPAILHDYLYWTQTGPRDSADLVLKFGMEDFGVDKTTRTAIYEAVHLFGNSAWQENISLKAMGEKRILSKVPDDPRVTWEQWKRDPAHFS